MSTVEPEEIVEATPDEPELWCWSCAVYSANRAYGGPEEGGWWYDCGTRVDERLDMDAAKCLPRFFLTEAEAVRYAEIVQASLDQTVNVGRRPISSMASEGVYRAIIHEGYPPEHYPTTRPRYE